MVRSHVLVCGGTGCTSSGSAKIIETLEKEIEKLDLIAHYSANLRKIICSEVGASEEEQPLKGIHFVVDASNGAGGFFASQVLEPLGADITGSIFLNPDGTFPNHVPNPENAKAMEDMTKEQ